MKRSIRSFIAFADNGNPKPLCEVDHSPERFRPCKRVLRRIIQVWTRQRKGEIT